ncbi:MAG: 50S ribosomal protein L11 methyltransferase [Acidimicrobiia bacterium]
MDFNNVTWKGRFGPFDLKVGPATFRPTTISVLLAASLEIEEGSVVVDVGCGSGVLAIVAARLGAAKVYGTDAAERTVEVASANAEAQGVGGITEFFEGDLFDPLPSGLQADVIIGDVSGIPDELAEESGWFPSGLSGGPTGAELPMRMLQDAKSLLRHGGKLFLPTGSLQDEQSVVQEARSLFESIRLLSERQIPLASALVEHPAFLRLRRAKGIDLAQRGSRLLGTARIWEISA